MNGIFNGKVGHVRRIGGNVGIEDSGEISKKGLPAELAAFLLVYVYYFHCFGIIVSANI